MKSLQVLKLLDTPMVIFGHCFGATVAFEVARILDKELNIVPKRLIVSSMVLSPAVSPSALRAPT